MEQSTPDTIEKAFTVDVPVRTWEDRSVVKSGRPQRMFAGVMSIESRDHEDQTVLQKGLDFTYFMKKGVFNDNHSQRTEDVLGWPVAVAQYAAGDALPDGTQAEYPCTWVQGCLSNRDNATAVWELAQDMETCGRSLGLSIEGKVQNLQKGDLTSGEIVAKAKVINCAITCNPMHDGTSLNALLRSMRPAQQANERNLAKGVTTAGYPGTAPGTNAANMREDVSPTQVNLAKTGGNKRKRRRKQAKKSLNAQAILQSVYQAHPDMPIEQAMGVAALASFYLACEGTTIR